MVPKVPIAGMPVKPSLPDLVAKTRLVVGPHRGLPVRKLCGCLRRVAVSEGLSPGAVPPLTTRHLHGEPQMSTTDTA
jgi:hypothetical protein